MEMIVHEYYKTKSLKMTPDPNHLWLRVSQDKQGDYSKTSCIQDQHTKMDNLC